MINLTRTLSAIITLVCVLMSTDAFAAVSPQQLLPQGTSGGAYDPKSSGADSTVTTLPPAAAPTETPRSNPDGTIIIVPIPPDAQGQQQTVTDPTTPGTTVIIPQPPATNPTPVQPAHPDGAQSLPAPPVQPPSTTATPEKPKDQKLLTPADFLPRTPNAPESAKGKKAEKTPPVPGKIQSPKTPPEKTPPPPKIPPKTAKGDMLKIPQDAGKTKDLSFLEGCWRGHLSGTRDRGKSSEQLGSRFCFDKNGKGKHLVEDKRQKESCAGSANGIMSANGDLRVDFDDVYCPSGEKWYPRGLKYMTCRDVNGNTACLWHYPGSTKPAGPFYKE